MSTINATTTSTGKVTFQESIPKVEANAAFRETLKPVKDGANNYLESFMAVAESVLESKPLSFSIQDFFYFSERYQIPVESTKELFLSWSEHMVQIGRLQKHEMCAYDYPLFSVR